MAQWLEHHETLGNQGFGSIPPKAQHVVCLKESKLNIVRNSAFANLYYKHKQWIKWGKNKSENVFYDQTRWVLALSYPPPPSNHLSYGIKNMDTFSNATYMRI